MAQELVDLVSWRVLLDASPSMDESLSIDMNIGSPLNVSNATNATPIRITTSSAHGYSDGMQVRIAGVTGNTAANGTWIIDMINSTDFDLLGSQGNAAYISGGTAQRIFLGRAFNMMLGFFTAQKVGGPWNPCSGTGGPIAGPTKPSMYVY